ncbi:MAG: hypothetical protein HND48_12140 [Chloroflexi bacterium]|nr:hypothetical protein [Chloroflexota bacterium]
MQRDSWFDTRSVRCKGGRDQQPQDEVSGGQYPRKHQHEARIWTAQGTDKPKARADQRKAGRTVQQRCGAIANLSDAIALQRAGGRYDYFEPTRQQKNSKKENREC